MPSICLFKPVHAEKKKADVFDLKWKAENCQTSSIFLQLRIECYGFRISSFIGQRGKSMLTSLILDGKLNNYHISHLCFAGKGKSVRPLIYVLMCTVFRKKFNRRQRNAKLLFLFLYIIFFIFLLILVSTTTAIHTSTATISSSMVP